jgi:hypothetical protein
MQIFGFEFRTMQEKVFFSFKYKIKHCNFNHIKKDFVVFSACMFKNFFKINFVVM